MKYEDLSADEQAMKFKLVLAEKKTVRKSWGDQTETLFANTTRFAVADLVAARPALIESVDSIKSVFAKMKLENDNLQLYLDFSHGSGLVADEYSHVCGSRVAAWGRELSLNQDLANNILYRILTWIADVHTKIKAANAKQGRRYDFEASREGGRCSNLSSFEQTFYDDAGNEIWKGRAYETSLPMDVKMFLLNEALDSGKCSFIIKVDEMRENAADKRIAVVEPDSAGHKALMEYDPRAAKKMKEKYVQAMDRLIEVYEAGDLPKTYNGLPLELTVCVDGDLKYYAQTGYDEFEEDENGDILRKTL